MRNSDAPSLGDKAVRVYSSIVAAMLKAGKREFSIVRDKDQYELKMDFPAPVEIPANLYPFIIQAMKYIFGMDIDRVQAQKSEIFLDCFDKKVCLHGFWDGGEDRETFQVSVYGPDNRLQQRGGDVGQGLNSVNFPEGSFMINQAKAVAPEPYFSAYLFVLNHAILCMRMWLRYDLKVPQDQIYDMLDAVHNIPTLIYAYNGWHVHENIVRDLQRYDDIWGSTALEEARCKLVPMLERAISDMEEHGHLTVPGIEGQPEGGAGCQDGGMKAL